MVEAGWAVPDERYYDEAADPTLYAIGVVQAESERRGMWHGTFTEPAEWRRQHRKGIEH